MECIKKYGPYIMIVLGVIPLVYYFIHDKPPAVTIQSQRDTETSQGVQQAANHAQVKLMQTQLDDAARQIAMLKSRPPDLEIQTVIKEVPAVSDQQRKANKADFSIIADPKEPDKSVDLGKFKPDQSVMLNQYNIHAYKKILRQVDYAPRSLSDWSPREIGYSISKKISQDGKYIGIAVDHDFDDNKTGVKLRFTY